MNLFHVVKRVNISTEADTSCDSLCWDWLIYKVSTLHTVAAKDSPFTTVRSVK